MLKHVAEVAGQIRGMRSRVCQDMWVADLAVVVACLVGLTMIWDEHTLRDIKKSSRGVQGGIKKQTAVSGPWRVAQALQGAVPV